MRLAVGDELCIRFTGIREHAAAGGMRGLQALNKAINTSTDAWEGVGSVVKIPNSKLSATRAASLRRQTCRRDLLGTQKEHNVQSIAPTASRRFRLESDQLRSHAKRNEDLCIDDKSVSGYIVSVLALLPAESVVSQIAWS